MVDAISLPLVVKCKAIFEILKYAISIKNIFFENS